MPSLAYPNELYHYGVLGMKWGVRKDPERAYGRASRKAKKLRLKAQKYKMKSSKYSMKLQKAKEKLHSRSTNEDNISRRAAKVVKLENRIKTLDKKESKVNEKANKWISQMEKTFSKIDLDSLPQSDITAGKDYVNYIWALQSEKAAKDNAATARRYIDKMSG